MIDSAVILPWALLFSVAAAIGSVVMVVRQGPSAIRRAMKAMLLPFIITAIIAAVDRDISARQPNLVMVLGIALAALLILLTSVVIVGRRNR